MEITTYLKIIARYWWVILLTTLVSAGVAFAITEIKSKTYAVHVRVVAQPASVVSNTNELINMEGQIGTREVMGTLAEAFTSADVQSNALQAAGMSATQALDYPIQANGLPDSSVIEVSGTGHDPNLLTSYVNATVDAGVKYGSSIYRVIDLVPMERATRQCTQIRVNSSTMLSTLTGRPSSVLVIRKSKDQISLGRVAIKFQIALAASPWARLP